MVKELIKKIIPPFLLSWYHFKLAFLGAVLYGFPARKMKVIGITGTNGKSTTAEMIAKILEEAGYKVALLDSIRFKIGEQEQPNLLKMTMPGRFQIQRFLRKAADSGCQYAVLEVTSEGIKQHRHRFIAFEAVVFTNLSPEHIEAHGSFENYRAAKGKLFKSAKNIHIINLDDENSDYFLKFSARKKYTYGWAKGDINDGKINLHLSLAGDFNVYNALAAIGVGVSQGIDLATCKRAVEGIREIPGRMEKVIAEPFRAFVDYAFTPNALEKVYQTIKTNLQPRKMICVLGACGGGRDKWKRPVLGKLAARYCDEIIVTNEDPYDENPMEIIEQVAKGTLGKAKKILDRREAISNSLKSAKPGDAIIITGKGCEPWIIEKGKKIPWDDRRVVKEEMGKLEHNGDVEYEILEHKADLKIRVFGETKEKLFLNALLGMQESMKYQIQVPREKTSRKVKIKSPDLAALLVDFLNEALYLIQTNKEIYDEARFIKFTATQINAGLFGQKVERFGEDIKAVTYHESGVRQKEDGGWEATLLFDV
jgi:UDP-N-acetylmuramoyl-L-alanyl-D-glutamate--2,6-diaminopimelate ligase